MLCPVCRIMSIVAVFLYILASPGFARCEDLAVRASSSKLRSLLAFTSTVFVNSSYKLPNVNRSLIILWSITSKCLHIYLYSFCITFSSSSDLKKLRKKVAYSCQLHFQKSQSQLQYCFAVLF